METTPFKVTLWVKNGGKEPTTVVPFLKPKKQFYRNNKILTSIPLADADFFSLGHQEHSFEPWERYKLYLLNSIQLMHPHKKLCLHSRTAVPPLHIKAAFP